mmetsp:Transcript_14303/g.24287  ORF Transcript_14303/g.24287 Transcript_14303/m.24287 type:complete len:242 (+) Transcript_14303:34-759(+)
MKITSPCAGGVLLLPLFRTALAYTPHHPDNVNRRAFLHTSSAAITSAALIGGIPRPCQAVDLKVTPIAHTFITSSGTAKPLRENDATRFLTNAKVVYLFEGSDASPTLSSEILGLTAKRKADEGPGVTPGNVVVASTNAQILDTARSLGLGVQSTKDLTPKSAAALATTISAGDVVVVGPLPSDGTANDAKVVLEVATNLGAVVGGAKSGGVISVLVDGPKEGLLLMEDGLPTSTILWYGV